MYCTVKTEVAYELGEDLPKELKSLQQSDFRFQYTVSFGEIEWILDENC